MRCATKLWHLIPAALLAVAIPCFPATAKEKPPKRVEMRKWIDGPIRYIALKPEMQTFRDLETDEDRAYYVERFWSRRDPPPGTLTNEFRQLFWERVQQANSQFLDIPRPGWISVRAHLQ